MARDPAALQLRLLQTVVEVAGEKKLFIAKKVESDHLGATALHFESVEAVPRADIQNSFAVEVRGNCELSKPIS